MRRRARRKRSDVSESAGRQEPRCHRGREARPLFAGRGDNYKAQLRSSRGLGGRCPPWGAWRIAQGIIAIAKPLSPPMLTRRRRESALAHLVLENDVESVDDAGNVTCRAGGRDISTWRGKAGK